MHEVDTRTVQVPEEKSVYIVNPHGTIHAVPESIANEQIKRDDWRLATDKETKELQKAKGMQSMKKRILPSLRGRPGQDKDHAFNDK